jgi:putative DNA primase/helicase
LGKEQFLAELVEKTANLAKELSSVKVISSGKMKSVISGDVVSAKRVYQPVFSFAPQALYVFTANLLPSSHGGVDEGIRRRFVVVPFTETIPVSKRVPEIAKRILESEKEAILALAVEGAARMIETGTYSISQAMNSGPLSDLMKSGLP